VEGSLPSTHKALDLISRTAEKQKIRLKTKQVSMPHGNSSDQAGWP
jgi:hypothetical protein